MKYTAFFSFCLLLFSGAVSAAESIPLLSAQSADDFKKSSSLVIRLLPEDKRLAFYTAYLQINISLGIQAAYISHEKGTDRKDELDLLYRENVNNKSYSEIIDMAKGILEDKKAVNEKQLEEISGYMKQLDPAGDLVSIVRGSADCDGVTYTVTNRFKDSELSVIYLIAGHNQLLGEASNRIREFELSCRLVETLKFGETGKAICEYPQLLREECTRLGGMDKITGYYENYFDANFSIPGYEKGFLNYHMLKNDYNKIMQDNDFINRKLSELNGKGERK